MILEFLKKMYMRSATGPPLDSTLEAHFDLFSNSE